MSDKYDLLYLDPPWFYNKRNNANTRYGGGAGIHYPLMKTKDICAMPIPDMMADRCLVFMWGCFPKDAEFHKVLKAWNLTFVSIGLLWVKLNKSGRVIYVPKNTAIDSHGNFTNKKSIVLDGGTQFGTGFYAKSNAEPCWLARKGRTYKPCRNDISNLVFAPHTGVHSEKPAEVRDRISMMYPDLRKAEVFARHTSSGWDSYGNEVGKLDGPPRLSLTLSESEGCR
ncbi:MAG: MT-A70 family methyltransferase [Armatimonadota bacterium]|nr:MT-A70 family methyltransferase [Armatimonadota bacterium]